MIKIKDLRSKVSGNYIWIILLLAAAFRFWQIGSVPPSPSLDEVSIGWNAYSLLETGRDEYGTSYPLLLRAYDDFRPALYVYLVMPFVNLIGLSATAVRLPSVILSLLSVLSVYYLARKIFSSYKKNAEAVGLVSALILAISPWHVYISRLGHEANAGLSFLILGVTFFVYRKMTWAVLFFALSFMSYQPQKIIVPIVVLALLISSHKYFLSNIRQTVMLVLFGSILVSSFIIVSLSPEATIRFRATNIFSSEVEKFNNAAEQFVKAKVAGNYLGQVVHHRYTTGAIIAFNQYVSHVNPKWLITNSGSEPHKVPGLGVLYWWELVGLLIGLYYMYKLPIKTKHKILLVLLLIIAPISAAITTGAPHAMRTYTAIPAICIISAIGIYQLILLFNRKRAFVVIGSYIVIFSLYRLYVGYFIAFPANQSDSFQYAYTQSIDYINANKDNYDSIVVSNEGQLYQSYMFYLFHTSYSPSDYLANGGTVSGGFAETHAIENIEFRPIDWEKDKQLSNTLFIGNTFDFPEDVSPDKEFNNLGKFVKVVSYHQ